jgi:MFS family permease
MKPKTILAVSFVATGLGGMPIWLLSAYSPFVIESLSLTSTEYGLLIATFFGCSALTGVWLGGSSARNGWVSGVIYTAILAAFGLSVMGLLASNWLVMASGIAISALANSLSQPSANLAIASAIRINRQGLAFGIKQAALPVATFVVGLSVPLFRFDNGWRFAFLTISLFALFFGAYVQIRTRQRLPTPVQMALAPKAKATDAPKQRTVSKPLFYLAVAAGLGTATTMTFAGFIVLYAVHIGLSPSLGALVLSIGSFTGVVSRVLSGYLADRRKGRHFKVVSYMMAGGAAGYILVAFSNNFYLLALGSMLSFGLGWAWNGVFHLAIVRINPERAANSTGVIQSGMALGATLGPAAFGAALIASFQIAWIALAVCMLCAAAMVLVGRRELNR